MRFSEIAGETGIFVDGDWIEKKDQDAKGAVRLIQLADVGPGEFRDKSDRHITVEKADELHCTFLRKGDILIARLGDPLCKACVFPLDGLYITAVDVAILRIGSDLKNLPTCLELSYRLSFMKKQKTKPKKHGLMDLPI